MKSKRMVLGKLNIALFNPTELCDWRLEISLSKSMCNGDIYFIIVIWKYALGMWWGKKE